MDVDDLDALVRRARRGDGAAFGCLFDRFHAPVVRYLFARTGERELAEDLASEVFAEVAQRLPKFHGDGGRFAGWIFTIARHDLSDVWRARARRRVDPVPDVPETTLAPDPAIQVEARLEAQRLARMVDRLTDDQREVVLLRFAAGLTVAEVAATVGKPVTAVKSLQHRALGALRRMLSAEAVCVDYPTTERQGRPR